MHWLEISVPSALHVAACAAVARLPRPSWRLLPLVCGLVGMVGWFAGPAVTCGQEAEVEVANPLDEALQRQVRLLQRQLNADQREARERAEQELVDLGSRVLDYLPSESPGQAGEMNIRLRRIRLALETKAALEVTQPLAIDLKGQWTVEEILQAIGQQTGNSIGMGWQREQPLEVDWQQLTFWEAVDELADATQATVRERPGIGLVLQPELLPASRRARASYHGAFRISPTRIQSTLDLKSTQPTITNLSLALEWEPKLRVIRLEMPLTEIEIRPAGEDQVEAAVVEAGGRIAFGVGTDQRTASVSFPLPGLGDRAAEAIDVTGRFQLLVAGREEKFRFDKLSEALAEKRTIERSGIRVQLEESDMQEHLMLIKIGIQFSDDKQSLESHLGWIYENQVELIDSKGGTHPYLTIESGGRRDQGIALIYLFERFADLDDISLVYRSPGILLEVDVPFELRGIPLP